MFPGRLIACGCIGGIRANDEGTGGIFLGLIVDDFERGIIVGYCGGTLAGATMSHDGSVGVEGSDDEDMGRMRTTVEFSQPCSIRGEYAGVDGSESIKVPNDFADIGVDTGAGDLGLIGDSFEANPSAEKC